MKSEKMTDEVVTRSRRRYEDACAAAHALDLVGDRWALLVMRELLLGPRRFGDLRASLPGISANILAQRLAELEASGVVLRRKLPPPARRPGLCAHRMGDGERADPAGARPLGGAVAAARPGLADQRGVLPVVAADHAGPGAGSRAAGADRLPAGGGGYSPATSPRAGSRSPRGRPHRPTSCCPARRRSWRPRSMAACRSPCWRPRARCGSRATGPWPSASSTFSPCRTRPCRPARARGRAARWSFDQTGACRAARIG